MGTINLKKFNTYHWLGLQYQKNLPIEGFNAFTACSSIIWPLTSASIPGVYFALPCSVSAFNPAPQRSVKGLTVNRLGEMACAAQRMALTPLVLLLPALSLVALWPLRANESVFIWRKGRLSFLRRTPQDSSWPCMLTSNFHCLGICSLKAYFSSPSSGQY